VESGEDCTLCCSDCGLKDEIFFYIMRAYNILFVLLGIASEWRPDRFVEYAFRSNRGNRLFRSFKLHTNGVLFDEERARLLLRMAHLPNQQSDTFNFIHFSIDAHSRPVYLEVKGADRQPQVYRNVERFLALRAEQGMERPYVTLAFVVQPDNADEALAYRDHWVDILRKLGRPHDICYDWPHRDQDALYYRPLNTADQVASDALHARVCRELGLIEGDQQRLRAAGSF